MLEAAQEPASPSFPAQVAPMVAPVVASAVALVLQLLLAQAGWPQVLRSRRTLWLEYAARLGNRTCRGTLRPLAPEAAVSLLSLASPSRLRLAAVAAASPLRRQANELGQRFFLSVPALRAVNG